MPRNNFFDSLKFVLIFLVVFGHTMEYNIYGDQVRRAVFGFIYSFHMPLFIFISGYFSKNITWAKYKKSFIALFLTYIVFQIYFTSLTFLTSEAFDLVDFLLNPKSVLWYIVGLLFWRFIFCFVSQYKLSFSILFPTTMLLYFAMSFYPESTLLVRMIHFLPFFTLGYYCSSDIIEKIRSWNRSLTAATLFIIFIGIYLFSNAFFILSSFGDLVNSRCPEGHNIILLKTTSFLLAIAMSVCIINLVSDKFAKFGSNTLGIYLLHPTFVYALYREFVIGDSEPQSWFLLIDFFAAIFITIACLFLCRLKIIQYIIDPIKLIKMRRQYE